uniref:F-box domain-containing protein n=1 Tax=Cacopsylla melanoneura TaxID=428564 RepID=A0A8D8TM59_9HEMI
MLPVEFTWIINCKLCGLSLPVTSTTEHNISSLCAEMKCLILEYLDIDDLLTFSLVSKEWYHFISSDTVWHERFNRLEKIEEEAEVFDNPTDVPPPNLYTVNRSLTQEQLEEVEGYQFVSVNNVKLAFFFNKTSLICNRLLATRGANRFTNKRSEYFVLTDDGIVWHNYNDRYAKHTQFKHGYILRNRTGPVDNDCFHYRCYDTRPMCINRKAYPTERQQYYGFFTSEQFLLGLCEPVIHVYRFSAETGRFNKTHELNMAPYVLLYNFPGTRLHWGNRTSTVSMVGESWIWKWDLINGEKMAQVNISNLMSPEEKLQHTYLAKDSQLVLVKTNKNVLLLDLAKAAVAWEVNMNSEQIEVTNQYIVTLEYNTLKSEQLFVYDVDSGSKLYEIPFPQPQAIYQMEELFLHRRGDILIIVPCKGYRGDVFYFDLKNRKQLKVTAQREDSEMNDYDVEYYDSDYYYMSDVSDTSSVKSYCSFDGDRFEEGPGLRFMDGPGETVIEVKPRVNSEGRCDISVRLIDYRNNRSIRIGRRNKLFELKIGDYQVGWDKEFRRWTLMIFKGLGRCCRYSLGHNPTLCRCFPQNVDNKVRI